MTPAILTLLFTAVTVQQGLPPELLSSLCYVESKHNIQAIHKDDGNSSSLGICQVKLSTAKWLGFKGTEKQLMKPETNIKYAGLFLQKQLHRYRNNVVKGIIAYNKGNAKGLTRTKYSDKVLKQWEIQKNVRECKANTCDNKRDRDPQFRSEK